MLKSSACDGSLIVESNEQDGGCDARERVVRRAGQTLCDLQGDVTWRVVEHAVMKAFAVGSGEINGGSRGAARAAHARQVAMYLAHITGHHSLTQVGRMANRDRTTVAHACAVIEDERDDPVFDEALNYLERSVMLMANRQSPSSSN